MEANFLRALPLVLKHEGGFSNHKDDPGGATNKGITLGTYRRYVKSDGTVLDLQNISAQDVEKVYKLFYWDAIKGDGLPFGVDYAVFDFAVNSGPGRAIKYLQAVVGVAQDGIIGPATLAAVRSRSPVTVINQLCDDRLTFLRKLSIWPTFGKGWTNRVTDVRAHALKMASDNAEAAPLSSYREVLQSEAVSPQIASAPVAAISGKASMNSKSVVAAISTAAVAGAVYCWNQITSLFGG